MPDVGYNGGIEKEQTMDEITTKLFAEHENEIREMVSHTRLAKEFNRKFVEASQNDDYDAASEAAGERNTHNNEAKRIQSKISAAACKISGSMYEGNWHEEAFKVF